MEKKQAKEKPEKETKRARIRGWLSDKKNKELSKELQTSSSENKKEQMKANTLTSVSDLEAKQQLPEKQEPIEELSSGELIPEPRTNGTPNFKIIDPMNLKSKEQKEAYVKVISQIKSRDYSMKSVNTPDIQSKPAGKAHHQSLETLVSKSSRQVKEASKEVPKEAQKAFSSNERSRV